MTFYQLAALLAIGVFALAILKCAPKRRTQIWK
jgi:hypothetical protein